MAHKICCVPGCGKSRSDNVALHMFPHPDNDAERFRTWLYTIGGDILQLENQKIMKYRKVCDRHFEEKYRTLSKRLTSNAVPTLNVRESVKNEHDYFKKRRHVDHTYCEPKVVEKHSETDNNVCNEWDVTQEHNYFKEQDEEDVAELSLVTTTGCADSFEHNYFKGQDDNFKSDPKNEKNILPDLSACEQSAPPEVLGGDESPRAALCDAMLSSADDDTPEPSPPPPPLLNLHTAQICRVCLALDVKMFHLRDAELKIMFRSITGIQFEDDEGSLGSLICWECAARLRAASTFRSKALLSDTLLQRLISKGEQIENEYFETVKEEADRLVPPKTLTVTEIIRIVDIEDQNNMSQLVQSGDDDQHSISDNSDTQSVMDENKDHINDEICQLDAEGVDHVALPNEIENHPICLSQAVEDENIKTVHDENPQFILPEVAETLLRNDLTSSLEDYDDQIIKTFLQSITKSKTVPEQNIEPKISNKRRKEAVSNDRSYYLKEDNEDGNKKKKLKTYGGTSKKISGLKAARNTQVF